MTYGSYHGGGGMKNGAAAAKVMAGKVSEALAVTPGTEAGLKALQNVLKISENAARYPDEKYRKLRRTKPAIQALLETPGVLPALLLMGWVEQEADGEPVLVMPNEAKPTGADVRDINQAILRVERAARDDEKARLLAKRKGNAEQQRLAEQIAADKQERKSEAPVTESAKACKINYGAKIIGAKAMGIDNDAGG